MPAIGAGARLSVQPPNGLSQQAGGFDFRRGMPTGVHCARSREALRLNGQGRVIRDGPDVARVDFDPGNGFAPRGLLVEPAATNLIGTSTPTIADWWSYQAALTVGVAMAPDGSSDAVGVIEAAGAAQQSRYYRADTVAGLTYSFSVHLKAAERRYAHVAVSSQVADQWYAATIDLLTGETCQMQAGSGGNLTAVVAVPLYQGWWRVTLTGSHASVLSFIYVGPAVAPNATISDYGVQIYVGDGESGILAWGAMIEAGEQASSLIETSNAPAMRPADIVTLDWGSRGIGDGERLIRYTLGNGVFEDVMTSIVGGVAQIPLTLPHPHVAHACIL